MGVLDIATPLQTPTPEAARSGRGIVDRMPSHPALTDVQDAIRRDAIDTLADGLAAGDHTEQLVAAALRMQRDLLAAHPDLTFPILYDRLIWAHGPALDGLTPEPPEPQPGLVALLERWRQAHGRPWLRSLWPPSSPLECIGLTRLPIPDGSATRPVAVAFSADGTKLAVAYGHSRSTVVVWALATGQVLGVCATDLSARQLFFHRTKHDLIVLLDRSDQALLALSERGLKPHEVPRLVREPRFTAELQRDGLRRTARGPDGQELSHLKGERACWLATPTQAKHWRAAWSTWQHDWRAPKTHAQPTLTEQGDRLVWRDGGPLTIWGIRSSGVAPLYRHDHIDSSSTQLPSAPLRFSRDGEHLVSSGIMHQFDDYDTAVVLRVRDGMVVASFSHRDSRWTERAEIPSLVAPSGSDWHMQKRSGWFDLTDASTGAVLMPLRGTQSSHPLVMCTRSGRGVAAVSTNHRRAVLEWTDATKVPATLRA